MSPVEMAGMPKCSAMCFAWVPLPAPGGPMMISLNAGVLSSPSAEVHDLHQLLERIAVLVEHPLDLPLHGRVALHVADDLADGVGPVVEVLGTLGALVGVPVEDGLH